MNTEELRQRILAELMRLKAGAPLIQAWSLADPDFVQAFIRAVDQSPFPLAQWGEALVKFDHWSKTEKRELPLPKAFEYLCCCVEGLKHHGSLLTLSDTLEHYLKEHGVA